MKNLKYFESSIDHSHWGIDAESIEEMFYDISDLGWMIRVILSKRLIKKETDELNLDYFDFQYYILVLIYKPFISIEREMLKYQLINLRNSEVFRDTILDTTLRLKQFGYSLSEKDIKLNSQNIEITFIKE